MNLTNEQTQKYISELPDNIRKAVITFDWAGEVMDIARTHNIQIDDIDEFRQETLKVILGLSPAADFEKNIMNAMSINRPKAQLLVDEANGRIFSELQKRAFSEENNSDDSIEESLIINDPYHEVISHDDVRNIRDEAGIELVDHDEPVLPEDTHQEKIKTQTINEHQSTQNDYLEPIEASDLRGANKQRIDTSILKTKRQSSPEAVLSKNEPPTLNQDLDKKINQDLDKKNMSEQVIIQHDVVDVSPNEHEVIAEDGSFLEHLSKNKEA